MKGLPWYSEGKASAGKARDLGSIPRSERSPGEGNGNTLQCYCLENSMELTRWKGQEREDWREKAFPVKEPVGSMLYPTIRLLNVRYYRKKTSRGEELMLKNQGEWRRDPGSFWVSILRIMTESYHWRRLWKVSTESEMDKLGTWKVCLFSSSALKGPFSPHCLGTHNNPEIHTQQAQTPSGRAQWHQDPVRGSGLSCGDCWVT